MTFVEGTTVWHAVRSIGDDITTVCGRHLPADTPTAEKILDHVFLCRACESGMRKVA
jgi:hypothetical protein